MTGNSLSNWQDFRVGQEVNGLTFTEKPFTIESEGFIGMPLANLIPTVLQESSFNSSWFTQSPQNRFHGGIIQANFALYQLKPHEEVGEIRQPDESNSNIYVGVDLDPSGNIIRYNPLMDDSLEKQGLIIGFCSRVMLNNLDIPGSFGGWGHFPMLDIIKPPTPENVQHILDEVPRRTGLKKFFVIQSSEHGMMLFAPEIIDEEHLLDFWSKSELMNHYEIYESDVWVDTRWVENSKKTSQKDLGLNNQQVCGVLRIREVPFVKPAPIVIAASF